MKLRETNSPVTATQMLRDCQKYGTDFKTTLSGVTDDGVKFSASVSGVLLGMTPEADLRLLESDVAFKFSASLHGKLKGGKKKPRGTVSAEVLAGFFGLEVEGTSEPSYESVERASAPPVAVNGSN